MKRPTYIRSKDDEKKIMQKFSEKLHYDPFSGAFFWKERVSCCRKPGMVAGTVSDHGRSYRKILLNGSQVMAHRLAWFMWHGKVPEFCIDHINGNRDDNRISNLRVVDEVLNQKNRKSHRSGRLPGTYLHQSGKWHSRINHNGKTISLKYHSTEKKAYEAYLDYARKNGIHLLTTEDPFYVHTIR